MTLKTACATPAGPMAVEPSGVCFQPSSAPDLSTNAAIFKIQPQCHACLTPKLYWAGLDAGDRQMLDHVRFTSELIRLRWDYPALRGQGFRVVHVHDENRVLAFHRWVEGEGRDVLVIVHLSTFNRFGYRIGVPDDGSWREIFNSDVYENWVNPNVSGNGGVVSADAQAMHGFENSAPFVLSANSILVFAR